MFLGSCSILASGSPSTHQSILTPSNNHCLSLYGDCRFSDSAASVVVWCSRMAQLPVSWKGTHSHAWGSLVLPHGTALRGPSISSCLLSHPAFSLVLARSPHLLINLTSISFSFSTSMIISSIDLVLFCFFFFIKSRRGNILQVTSVLGLSMNFTEAKGTWKILTVFLKSLVCTSRLGPTEVS